MCEFEFNFDDWARLADQQPEIFEAKRKALIDAYIERMSRKHRRRMIGLQFTIDSRRSLAKSPLQSCLWLSSQMHDSFCDMQTHLNEFLKNHSQFIRCSSAKTKPRLVYSKASEF